MRITLTEDEIRNALRTVAEEKISIVKTFDVSNCYFVDTGGELISGIEFVCDDEEI